MITKTTFHRPPLFRVLFTLLLAITAVYAAPTIVQAQTFYVSTGTDAIDKVDSSGSVTLFATMPASSSPQGLAFDSGGNLYAVAYNTDQISKIAPGGVVSLFATLPSSSGNTGLAIDGSGNLYAANIYSGQISKITPGGVVSLFATVASPVGLAFDGSGNLYAANFGTGQISKITPGGTVSLFATLPGGSYPTGLAFDTSGNLFASDQNNGQISKITPSGAVSLFASLPGGAPTAGLAFDSSGNLYAANDATNQIYMITSGGVVSVFATAIQIPYFIAIRTTYSAQVQQPINPDGSSVFSVKRGVVPVKFTLTLNGVAACQLPAATISLTRIQGAILGSIAESTYLLSSDTGSNFRISDCQYVYNLAAGSLGPGTYTVNILIGGNVVGNGTFGLH
jgi:sugar lactone lactonase YvrE